MKQSDHLNVQLAKKFTGTVNSLFPLQKLMYVLMYSYVVEVYILILIFLKHVVHYEKVQ